MDGWVDRQNIFDTKMETCVIALTTKALLEVVFVTLKSQNDVVELLGLGAQLFTFQAINLKGLDTLLQNSLSFSLQLLFRLLYFLMFDFLNLLKVIDGISRLLVEFSTGGFVACRGVSYSKTQLCHTNHPLRRLNYTNAKFPSRFP